MAALMKSAAIRAIVESSVAKRTASRLAARPPLGDEEVVGALAAVMRQEGVTAPSFAPGAARAPAPGTWPCAASQVASAKRDSPSDGKPRLPKMRSHRRRT